MQLPKNRILYVDDHKDSSSMMKILLGTWDYELALADTAADGFLLAQSKPFDLYLFETHLPDGSGLELCKQICGVPGHAPVVFISASAYQTDIQRGLQAGAIAYFTKPLDFDLLEVTLRWLLAKTPGN